MRRVARTLLAAGALAFPGVASAATIPVNAQFAEFGPAQVDLLPGETVEWTNVSERRHTVNADDESFASGDLFGGDKFAREFDEVGVYPYHCTVHDGMTGEVDVRRVTLGPLPVAPVPLGDEVEFEGRTADPAEPVRIERAAGAGFETVATASAAADGSWSVAAAAPATGDYRAATAAGVSESRRLLVSDRKIIVRATKRGIAVTVTPALPYGRIALQEDLLQRFGWWPVKRTRLDYVSKATFAVKRPARVRVALLDRDGWTAVVTSRVVQLGRRTKSTPQSEHPRMDHMARR
jgi:plastocyanin